MESKLTEARRSLRNAKILAEMEMPLSAINNVNNAIELFEQEMEQPKLSIPKMIAEQADKTDFYLLFREGQEEFYQWFDHEHDEYKEVIYAYLAGRAIGVELVEVTDD